MSNSFEWVRDMLEGIGQNPTPDNIKLIERCGRQCVINSHLLDHASKMREASANCKTLEDYVAMLNAIMKAQAEATGVTYRKRPYA